ncbi:MAG: outer membrane protein assembly factor BamC [Rhodocyclaceae bacterium]|jgi:outer membrane protein assembly factor BamC|nr:outer membrane protein assembly factor BamC [Rhodocyclaceae bacterium]MCL4759035.1 outer membrane protein assembly factor BamC [Rhodocyclaceae bacterium]
MLKNPKIRTSVSLLALAIGVAGCSGTVLESKKIDYKSARQITPLEIPPDLTSPGRDERYVVPGGGARGVATYSAYASEREAQPGRATTPGVLAAVDERMRIERAGSQRWLVVPGAPEALWQDLKDFWLGLGFILNVDNPNIGVMETDWAEDRAKIPQDFVRAALGKVLDGLFSTAERDRFRTRIEQGKEPGTVEIYVSHRGMIEVYSSEAKDSTIWQPRPADPELEAEMLRRLMIHLGVQEERATAMLSAPAAAERATLATGAGGERYLSLDESFDRAWRRVGLALDRIGFTVEDRDRSKGLFFVRYIDPDAEARSGNQEGLLARLAFWRDRDTGAAKGGSEYRILVSGTGTSSRVSVLTREGGQDVSPTAQRMLALLQEQLR